ncbi:MAG: ABC transporter ATP-binding protein [Puniceicoccales bacterium]|nr:ABC transporter ATP-binding protein [Puniceicoccales bacterium]
MSERPIVELRNVSKSFGGYSVLRNVEFSLIFGESVSICGASGTGKTTLLNIVSLLERPDSGIVLWDGEVASNNRTSGTLEARRKILGFVFQNHNLIYELNAMENVLLPLRVWKYPSKQDVNFAKSLLEAVGMRDKKYSNIDVLSGGERQRVALARALINKPRVILADEPTGNLDETNARGAVDLMLNICKQNDSSLLLITHNQRLSKLTDRAFILSGGKLLLVRMLGKIFRFGQDYV